jgi:MFS family permease
VSLQFREFRLLFLATIVAHFGEQLQQFANLWQIYTLTGSALHLGLTGLARAIPVIFFSMIGGVLADRLDRKRIIVFAQVAGGFFAIILGVLTATGLIEVWHIYVTTFFSATLNSAAMPARRAVIGSVVPRHHLANAFALNMSVNQLDRIIAPSLAGILIALVGIPFTYGINAASHVITATSLVPISLGPAPARSTRSPLRDLAEALAFVRLRSIILVLLGMDVVAMLLGSYRPLLPVIAGQFETGPTGFGLLSSAPAVGSLIGATVVMYLGDVPYKGRIIVVALFGYCGAVVTLGMSPWFWLALVAAAGLGLTDAVGSATRGTVIQLMTPDALRGRVSAFQHMLQGGSPALGQSFMGAAAAAVGYPAALVSGGLICAAVCLSIVLRRKDVLDRDIDASPELARVGSVPPNPVPAG